ncbi:MAG: hypothetical protein Q4D54_02085 [Eubacteriales bacterium]|nr:hypothetical protein [Lachnospiraceae bacterium]MDO5126521.1 hypothetical protein [Eubacteriales bacterium]
MKTCHVCGCEVDDKELVCPDCGATVVIATSGLSLKAETEKRKSGNPMGQTIGTGSGYTDILRAEDDEVYDAEDDPFHGGSIPTSFAKTHIEDGEYKKKKNRARIIGNIIKVVFVLALAFGIYLFVTKVVLKKEGVDNVDDAIDVFVEAVNAKDKSKLKEIMPPYYNQLEEAEYCIERMDSVTISGNKVVNRNTIDRIELDQIQEMLKAEKNRMVYLEDGCKVTFAMNGTVVKKNGGTDFNFAGEVTLQFFELKGKWYLDTDSIDYSFFVPDYIN